MTFRPDQIQTTDAWLAEHRGHTITEEAKSYPLEGTASRVLRWKVCTTCGKRHLYRMETI